MVLSPSVGLEPAVRVLKRSSAVRRTTRQCKREELAHDRIPLPDRENPNRTDQLAITALNGTALMSYRQETTLAEPLSREQP